MIYITGDCHSDFNRFSTDNFPEQRKMKKDDYVIICGDFGGVWSYEKESREEKYWLDWLESKNFTTLFIDGNHENFDRLNEYPIEEFEGGKVHKIRPSVLHLMRGEVFEIEGKKIFAFGGASSHDIEAGILNMDEKDKIVRLRKIGARYRVRNLSWWDRELPTDEEMENGLKNLKKVDFKVDYIISHCAPTNIQSLIDPVSFKPDYLTNYLQTIFEKTEFTRWYFGHYHKEKRINLECILLYENIVPLL